MNEEYLVGAVIRQAVFDLQSDNKKTRIEAYIFLYRKRPSLMCYNDLDTDDLVIRLLGSLEPVRKIEKEMKRK